jgi:TctA family transporter
MKNTFATSDYNLLIAIGTALATMLAFALPLPLLLGMGAGPEKAMALVMLICLLPLFISRKGSDGKWWYALLVPLAGWLLVYIILKSALLTLRQGGIYWRESFYPLSDLRKNV